MLLLILSSFLISPCFFFFFFNDTSTTEIYTLSLHDALPIWCGDRPVALDARLPPLLQLPRGRVPGVGVAGAIPPEFHPAGRRAVDSAPPGRVTGVRAAQEP